MIKLHKLSKNYFTKVCYSGVDLYKRLDANTFELVLTYDFCCDSSDVKFQGEITNKSFDIAKKFYNACKQKYEEFCDENEISCDGILRDE